MSPEIVIQDVVGRAIKSISMPDQLGSVHEVDETRAEVIARGVVRLDSSLFEGTRDFFTGKEVNGGGVLIDFSSGAGSARLRREVDGEVSFLNVLTTSTDR